MLLWNIHIVFHVKVLMDQCLTSNPDIHTEGSYCMLTTVKGYCMPYQLYIGNRAG